MVAHVRLQILDASVILHVNIHCIFIIVAHIYVWARDGVRVMTFATLLHISLYTEQHRQQQCHPNIYKLQSFNTNNTTYLRECMGNTQYRVHRGHIQACSS